MEWLFEQICNLSISASWLISAVFAARYLLKKAPKKYICALWLLVGIRLVFPFSVESALSLVPAVDVAAVSELTQEKESLPEAETENNFTVPTVGEDFQAKNYVVDGNYNITPDDSANEQFTAEVPAAETKTISEMEILSDVWAAGVTVMFLYFIGSFCILKQKLSTAVILRENIRQSEYVDSPFILGVLRPCIYIPYQLPEESLEYVIAHENIHIRRKDHWSKVIAFFILSVYWFHPLVWLSYRYLCKDIEMACDEQVVEGMTGENRKAYSRALLSCHGKNTWYHACPVGFGEVNVRERVVRVLNYRKPSFRAMLSVFLFGILLAVCFLTSAKTDHDMEEQLPQSGEVQVNGRVDFGDLDNNGQMDYYIYETGQDENYHGLMTIYMNEEPIYTYKSEWEIMQAMAKYEDLDGDRRKELFVSWVPPVNSMPLMEYFVLDKTAEGWKELEMIHGENVHDNAFPITMNYGIHQDILEIGCEGSTVKIFYDLKEHYEKMLEEYAAYADSDLYHSFQRVLNGADYEQGKEFGSVASWGIHEIDTAVCHREIDGEYIDQTCLIAAHGLQGPEGKYDALGNLFIYFNYDSEGNVQILDMKLENIKGGAMNPEHMIAEFPEKQVWVYYDEWVDGIYKGIEVSKEHEGNRYHYEWYFDAHIADSYYSPEAALIHGGEHLFIQFTQGTGSGLHQTEVHILDLESMEEIPVQSPEKLLLEELKTEEMNFETGEIRFSYQGKSVVEKVDPKELTEDISSAVGHGAIFRYQAENDQLSYTTALSASPSCFLGDLTLQYVYRDGSYQVESMSYESEKIPLETAYAEGDFDGNGLRDHVKAECFGEAGDYKNVLTVTMDSGENAEIVYEGRTGNRADYLTLQTGKLRYSDRDCIVLEITNGPSNYASTDIHVLSILKDSEKIKLVEEATVLDASPKEKRTEKYADTLIGLEQNEAISLSSTEELIQYVERLDRNVVQIWEYIKNVKMYLYWDGNDWILDRLIKNHTF